MEDFLIWVKSEEFIKLLKDPTMVALYITLAVAIISRLFIPKASIIYGITHGASFSIPQTQGGTLLISTGSVSVRNSGRATAENVEFYFACKPEHYQIWPTIQYNEETLANNNFLIRIPFIKREESFNIELIQSHVSPPALLNVRATEGNCSSVIMAPMRVVSEFIKYILWLFLIIGMYQCVVWLIKLILLL